MSPKKRKIDDNETESHSIFSNFTVQKVLREDVRQKVMILQGHFEDDSNINSRDETTSEKTTAVVVLERNPFDPQNIQTYLGNTKTAETLKNDIYSTHNVFPTRPSSDMKATVINPATEKHVAKYSDHEPYVIHETPHLYESVTLPCLQKSKFSIQWVYNILDKKTESERIVAEDSDPEIGFVMLPDLKWDRKNMDSLYLIAIVHKHDLKSIRDMRREHLPLLRNIVTKGKKAIQDQFNIPPEKLRVYFHYQPSYYHLHVHFTHIKFDPPGSDVLRAHLIEDVISNIEIDSQFYSRKTLSYVVKDHQDLFKAYVDFGYLK